MKELLKLLLTLACIAISCAAAQRQPAYAADLGKIMPLGDSITAGYTPTGGIPGGYREELFRQLASAGHTFSFVGSQTTYPSSVLTEAGQERHEGHNAYTIAQIIDGIEHSDWLSVDPDIILLHIGANDVLSPDAAAAPQRLDALLSSIAARQPDAHIIVAKIIGGSDVGNSSHAAAYDQAIVAYNTAIADKVAAHADNGQHVSLIDMYGLLNIMRQTDEQGRMLFADVSHPNQLGYDVMGAAWAEAIQSVRVPEPAGAFSAITGLCCLVLVHLCRRKCTKKRN